MESIQAYSGLDIQDLSQTIPSRTTVSSAVILSNPGYHIFFLNARTSAQAINGKPEYVVLGAPPLANAPRLRSSRSSPYTLVHSSLLASIPRKDLFSEEGIGKSAGIPRYKKKEYQCDAHFKD
jgi:hypothetical protein